MNIVVIFIILLGIVMVFTIIKKPFLGVIFLVALEPIKSAIPSDTLAALASTLIGGLTLVSFLMNKARKRFKEKNGLSIKPGALYFFTGWFLFSIFLGQYFTIGTFGRDLFLTFFQLAVMVVLIYELIVGEEEIRVLMAVMVAVFFINSVIGITQTWFSPLDTDSIVKASGLTGNQNEFSIYASIGFIFCYYFWSHSPSQYGIFIFFLAGVFLVAIFFSGSRGGTLFTGASIIYLVLRSGKVRLRSIGYMILIILAVVIVWQSLPTELINRFTQIPELILNGEDTVGIRYAAWGAAYNLWLEHPFFGVGAGRFIYYNQMYNLVPGHSYIVPHSMYMTILSEDGLFGTIPFLGMLITSAIYLFQADKKTLRGKEFLDLVISWQAVLLFSYMTGIKGSIEYQKFFWMNFGISAVIMRISREMGQENADS